MIYNQRENWSMHWAMAIIVVCVITRTVYCIRQRCLDASNGRALVFHERRVSDLECFVPIGGGLWCTINLASLMILPSPSSIAAQEC